MVSNVLELSIGTESPYLVVALWTGGFAATCADISGSRRLPDHDGFLSNWDSRSCFKRHRFDARSEVSKKQTNCLCGEVFLFTRDWATKWANWSNVKCFSLIPCKNISHEEESGCPSCARRRMELLI